MAKLVRTRPMWIALLGAISIALVAAFVFLPKTMLGSPDLRLTSLASSLADFWNSGQSDVPPNLANLMDYWRGWHASSR